MRVSLMAVVMHLFLSAVLAGGFALALADPSRAQSTVPTVYHEIEVRLQFKRGRVGGMRVRLLRQAGLRLIAETFSRPEGQARFTQITEGEYVIETLETDTFEATTTNVSVYPPDRERPRPTVVMALVEIPLKPPPDTVKPGVVAADLDLAVPKAALKHYRAGMKALDSGNSVRAVAELESALKIHPDYYAARLELGRQLRMQKKFQEAAETLQPLGQLAPKQAEPRVEYGIVLLALKRHDEAAVELQAAVRLAESNWAAHYYLGWTLLERDEEAAARHLQRAIELNERDAARAHLALARVADAKGMRQIALDHLDAYLSIAPNAPDAEAARKLAERLRM